jgi:DNA-binding PadR family transcriptional regulator
MSTISLAIGQGEQDLKSETKVTEHEGMLLALILRQQPVTAYQLFRFFETSPVTSINASKGQLYPAIKRLRERGLIEGRKVAGDGRGAEALSVTDAGRDMVRSWTRAIDATHITLDDPLRTRILSFDMLSRDERLEWIVKAKALVKQRRAIVEEYNQSVTVPYQDFAYASVMEALRVKMEWLDELLFHVAPSD